MVVATSLKELAVRYAIRRVAIACGVFDGVHLGHQSIINRVVAFSRSTAAAPVVMTFDPHPRALLQAAAPPLLTSREYKLSLFERMGVEAVVVVPFTKEIADLSADDFLDLELLTEGIELTGICVGSSWRFGSGGGGSTATLEFWGQRHGFHVVSVPELEWHGAPVSSTRIREALMAGNLDMAKSMLGRPFAVRGKVGHGRGIGLAQLHCPTANLASANVLLPPEGVYAGKIIIEPGTSSAGVAGGVDGRNGIIYVGTAPSMEHPHKKPIIECHLFDFNCDIYGTEIEVCFRDFIRGDQRFDSAAALTAQIVRDIEQARRILAE